MFNFINITFAIVRELSPPQRFNLSANVLTTKMESEPEPNNAFEQKVRNICKNVELFCLPLS